VAELAWPSLSTVGAKKEKRGTGMNAARAL
jgi:hypothetical protein